MEELRNIHVICAYATGAGFALRGMLALTQSTVLDHRLVKTIPHLVDTLLLGSALAMLYRLSLSPLQAPWLSAKIVALLAYIGFGLLMLRFGRSRARRLAGFIGGLLTYGYIVGAAHSKSAWSWVAFLSP
ncbi:MAG: SirB2 family protein [Pseudomonadota bacterium]